MYNISNMTNQLEDYPFTLGLSKKKVSSNSCLRLLRLDNSTFRGCMFTELIVRSTKFGYGSLTLMLCLHWTCHSKIKNKWKVKDCLLINILFTKVYTFSWNAQTFSLGPFTVHILRNHFDGCVSFRYTDERWRHE